jgi:serine/threonine protein phosphatase PrpC
MTLWTCDMAWASHPGKVRPNNEDALLVGSPVAGVGLMLVQERQIEGGDSLLLAVADGVGGHNAGEIASRETVQFLAQMAERTPENLADGLVRLHDHLRRLADSRPDWSGMGSTVAGIMAGPQGLWVFHLDDSRVYQMRDRFMEQLTEDDSLASVLVRAGQLAADDPRPAGSNALTQFLGATHLQSPVQPHLQPVKLSGPRRFLLCTDGLSEALTLDEMEICMAGDPRPAFACEALLTRALETGARDNVTLIVADIRPAEPLTRPPSQASSENHPL